MTHSLLQGATATKHQMLPSGKTVKFRREQMIVWAFAAAFVGAAFIAGLYFGILEANWHLFSLKHTWDHLLPESWWPIYRHSAFRDIPEPAFATMGVLTLIVKPKYWDKRVSTLRLVTAPFILVIATLALGVLGTWLLKFGLPEHVRHVLAWHSVGNIALGIAIGRLMHFFWAPVGATIQGNLLDGSAGNAVVFNHVPAWVRLPFAPPVLRERFSRMFLAEKAGEQFKPEQAAQPVRQTRYWLVSAMVVVFALITALGIIGHFWVGVMGHTVPFIQPIG